jgi:hypothetical protein
MDLDGLTLEQQKDFDEIVSGLHQSVSLVSYMNSLGNEIDFLEKFRYVVNNAALSREEAA